MTFLLELSNFKSFEKHLLKIPSAGLILIDGVSGSGKSTLINDTLYPYLANELNGAALDVGDNGGVEGQGSLDKIINIDQSPIGRTPRSNPATYIGLRTPIRELFAQTKEAKLKGFGPGRFSFNVADGRCEKCEGNGTIKIEMNFLPDVYITCEDCKGTRFNKETLTILYKGKTISQVLNSLVDKGNTVIVIEHNLDVVKTADWVIDLGPEGGSGGGEVVAVGTPEDVVKVKKSYTGSYLKKVLDKA